MSPYADAKASAAELLGELQMALTVNHSTRTIEEFLNLYKNRSLNLAPAFQRQSVWNMPDLHLLIQSILDSIPLPAIYLYKQVGQGGKPVYDVIDGNQRLETIFLFINRSPFRRNDELLVRPRLPHPTTA